MTHKNIGNQSKILPILRFACLVVAKNDKHIAQMVVRNGDESHGRSRKKNILNKQKNMIGILIMAYDNPHITG